MNLPVHFKRKLPVWIYLLGVCGFLYLFSFGGMTEPVYVITEGGKTIAPLRLFQIPEMRFGRLTLLYLAFVVFWALAGDRLFKLKSKRSVTWLMAAAAAFVYGAVFQWAMEAFFAGCSFKQVSLLDWYSCGLVMCGAAMLLFLLTHAAELFLKRSYWILMLSWMKVCLYMVYLCLPSYLYSYYIYSEIRPQLNYAVLHIDQPLQTYLQQLGNSQIELVIVLFLSTAVIAFIIPEIVYLIHMDTFARGLIQKGLDNPVKSGCLRRLILYVTPMDILDTPMPRPQWFAALYRYGSGSMEARNLGAFVVGDTCIASPFGLMRGLVPEGDYEEKIVLLAQCDRMTLFNADFTGDYTARQYREMAAYLDKMAGDGWEVLVWERLISHRSLDRGEVEKAWLYGKYPAVISASKDFPMQQLDQIRSLKAKRERYLKLYEPARASGDDILITQVRRLLCGETAAEEFYDLMKLSQYCIHVRALIALSRGDKDLTPETLVDFSAGDMQSRQKRTQETSVYDLNLIRACKMLSELLEVRPPKKADYNTVSALIPQLRNRFIGHGSMLFVADDRLIDPLITVTEKIVEVFLADDHTLTGHLMILENVCGKTIPVMKMIGGRPFLFTGLSKKEKNRTFLCYENGKIAEYSPDMSRRIFYPVTLRKGEGPRELMPMDLQRIPKLKKRWQFKKDYLEGAPAVERCVLRPVPEAEDPLSRIYLKDYYNGRPYFKDDDSFKQMFKMLKGNRLADPEIFNRYLILKHCPHIACLYLGQEWDALADDYAASFDENTPGWRDAVAYSDETEESYTVKIMIMALMTCRGLGIPGVAVRIAVLGETRYPVFNPFPWIRSLEIRQFEDQEEMVAWGTNTTDYIRGTLPLYMKGSLPKRLEPALDMSLRPAVFKRILEEMDERSPLGNRGQNTIFRAGFINNVLYYEDLTSECIGLMDYLEFNYLSVQYFCLLLHGVPAGDADLKVNFRHMADQILKFMPKDLPAGETVRMAIRLPKRCRTLQKYLSSCLPFTVSGETMDFEGLSAFLGNLRCAVRAHGFIQAEFAEVLWELLLYYVVCLHKFLNLKDFVIFDGYGNFSVLGYKDCDTYVSDIGSAYFSVQDGIVCPLWEIRKGHYRYMNFFRGRFTVPELSGPEA